MYSIYEVSGKETLTDIAQKLDITTEQLLQLNGNIDMVPGQLIVVPRQNELYQNYVVKKGDNLYEIAKKYNTDIKIIELLNGLEAEEYIYPNQNILIPKENINVYVTGSNDTITDVLNNLSIDFKMLDKLNSKVYLQPEQIIFYSKKDLK